MPRIRQRITGEAARKEIKRKNTALHPLLRFGSKHHSLWQTILHEGGHTGLTAYQMKLKDHNYHPQILADLRRAELVQKLPGRNANNEYRYTADPAGKGKIVQEIACEVQIYETEDGEFLARTTIIGKRNPKGKIKRYLGTKKFVFPIPALEDTEIVDLADLDTDEDFVQRGKTLFLPVLPGQVRKMTDAELSEGCVIEGDYAIIKE